MSSPPPGGSGGSGDRRLGRGWTGKLCVTRGPGGRKPSRTLPSVRRRSTHCRTGCGRPGRPGATPPGRCRSCGTTPTAGRPTAEPHSFSLGNPPEGPPMPPAAIRRFFPLEDEVRPLANAQDLPPPPPWRDFIRLRPVTGAAAPGPAQPEQVPENRFRGGGMEINDEVVDAVNAALILRRPLLVTGKPGIGKSSLAYAIAYRLALGRVLVWPITSRSTHKQGLYEYDAVARLENAS